MNKNVLKGVIVLVALTVLSGLGLGAVNAITKAPIAQAEQDKKTAAYRIVCPEADVFEETAGVDLNKVASFLEEAGYVNDTISEVMTAKKGGADAGYAITVTNSAGYGGDATFTVGLDAAGTVTGITFLDLAESPGLGMEARDDPSWSAQFKGKIAPELTVVKGGSADEESDETSPEIDAISGATITSSAVTDGVNAVLAFYGELLK